MRVRRLRGRFYRKTGGPRQIGHRCKEYFGGCIVCESYRYLDEHGRFPTFDEVTPVCDQESRKEHETWLKTEAGVAWSHRKEEKRA